MQEIDLQIKKVYTSYREEVHGVRKEC